MFTKWDYSLAQKQIPGHIIVMSAFNEMLFGPNCPMK